MASSWRYDTEIRARARGLGYRLGIVGVRQLLDLRVGPLELRREPAHLRLQVVVLPLGAGARQRAVPHGERVRDGLGTFAQVAHRLLPLLAPRRDRPRLLLALLPQLLRLEEERPARREAARVAAREALGVVGEEAAEQLVPKQREQARVPAEHRQRALPRVQVTRVLFRDDADATGAKPGFPASLAASNKLSSCEHIKSMYSS